MPFDDFRLYLVLGSHMRLNSPLSRNDSWEYGESRYALGNGRRGPLELGLN